MDEFDNMNERLDPNSPYYKQNLEALNSPEHKASIEEQKRKIAEFKAMQIQPMEQQAPIMQQPMQSEQTAEVEDPRLTEALDRQNKLHMYSNLLRGFQKIAQAPATAQGFKADYAGSDMLMKAGDRSVEQYKNQLTLEKEKKKEKKDDKLQSLQLDEFQTKLAKSKIDLQNDQLNNDPSSENSAMAQERLVSLKEKEFGRKLSDAEVGNIKRQSAVSIFKYLPQLQEDVYKAMDYRQKDLDRTSAEKLSREKLAYDAKREVNKEERDDKKIESKEDQAITKENRKERKQLDKDYQTWNSLEQQIDDAIKKVTVYNKGSTAGSGSWAKAKTFVGALAPETQSVNTSLQKLSMDQLVKQFSGMSKAIDTPTERAAFEATVPGIGMDNALLMDELMKRKEAAIKAKERIEEGRKQYDRYGNFVNEEKQSTSAYPKQVRKGNLVATVGSPEEEKEANDEGFQ